MEEESEGRAQAKEEAPAHDSVIGGVAWSPWTCFAPIASAAVVVLLALGFARVVRYSGLELEAPRIALEELLPGFSAPAAPNDADVEPAAAAAELSGPLDLLSHELRARILWALAALALSVTLLAALAAAWRTIHCRLRPLGRRRPVIVAASVLFVALLGLLVWVRRSEVLPHVLQVLVDELSPRVKDVREASKGIGVAAIASMLLALGALLLPGERSVAEVTAQEQSLRRWLFLAAALLVAGVLEVSFLLHWPMARLSAANAAAVGRIAGVVTTGAGTLLTLLLAVTYGTAAAVMQERARSLAPRVEPARRVEWLAEHGLETTFGQQLVRVVAVLAPLVAGGPLTALLESLG